MTCATCNCCCLNSHLSSALRSGQKLSTSRWLTTLAARTAQLYKPSAPTRRAWATVAERHALTSGEAGGAQVITATPRQLESSVRLAEALAKMRLSPTVEREDVLEGLRLMKVGS